MDLDSNKQYILKKEIKYTQERYKTKMFKAIREMPKLTGYLTVLKNLLFLHLGVVVVVLKGLHLLEKSTEIFANQI